MLGAGAAVLVLAAGGALAGWHYHSLAAHSPHGAPGAKAGHGAPAAGALRSPSPSASGQPSSASPDPSRATGPAGVVIAYFAAINAHRWARAWHLGGDLTAPSLPVFASDYGTTAHDAVTIESVSRDYVSARLAATQTDGRVKVFSGIYTVAHGVIVHFDVQQVS